MTRKTRISFADQLRANDAALKFYGKFTGKEVPGKWLNNKAMPKPRVRRLAEGMSEAEILKACIAYLKKHPSVRMCWRQNSGTFKEGSRYIRANTARGMSDIMGVLRDGRTLAVEVKSAGGVLADHQKKFIDDIAKAGGVSFCCHSIDECIEFMGKI